MQSRARLEYLLSTTGGSQCCTILNQPNLHMQKQQVKSTFGVSLTVKTNPKQVNNVRDLVIMNEICRDTY